MSNAKHKTLCYRSLSFLFLILQLRFAAIGQKICLTSQMSQPLKEYKSRTINATTYTETTSKSSMNF